MADEKTTTTEESLPSGETNVETPPTQETTPPASEKAAPQTMADVARQAFEESTARNEGEGAVQELDTTPEKEEKVEGEEEEPKPDDKTKTEEKDDDDEGQPPPFDKHPRWIQRTKEFNETKAKLVETEAKLKQFEPQQKQWEYHQTFLQRFGIPETEVANMMNFLALMRADPAKAREAIRPVWNQLSEFDESAIPKDLADKVEAGELTKEMAERLWRAETRNRAGTVTGKLTAEQMARQQEAQRSEALASWDMSKRSSDPDFKPKINGAQDGLWELTAKGFTYLKVTQNPGSVNDEVRLLEQAYSDAKKLIASWRPPVSNGRRVPTSSRSSEQRKARPKTIDEVVVQTARAHGIDWNGRSSQ